MTQPFMWNKTVVWSLVFSLIFSMVVLCPEPSAAQSAEYRYEFKNVGLDGETGIPEQFVLTGAPSTTRPRVIKTGYGVRLETHPFNANNNRSFHIPVPASGTYQVSFSGFRDKVGGLSKLEIDDIFVGNYDFNAESNQAGPIVELNAINLTGGTHTLKLTTISESSSTPYMYPTQLILRKVPSEDAVLDRVELTMNRETVLLGGTADLQATGILDDGMEINLNNSQLQFSSDDPSIALVSATGKIRGTGLGTTTIRVSATFRGGVKEAALSIRTTDDIAIYTEKWGLITEAEEAPLIDGLLDDNIWSNVQGLQNFVTAYHNVPVSNSAEVKLAFNQSRLFIAISQFDPDETLANFELFLSPSSSAESIFRIPVKIAPSDPNYNNIFAGASTIAPSSSQHKIVRDHNTVTVELSLPLSLFGISEITHGEEWRFNLLTQHKMYALPTGSWLPFRTSSVHFGESNVSNFYADIVNEGRLGSIFTGQLPDLSQPWQPEEVHLKYTGYNEKQLVFKELTINPNSVQLLWKEPNGIWEAIEQPQINSNQGYVEISFQHPDPKKNGLYQLQIKAQDEEAVAYSSIVSFDRHALIQAGDAQYNLPLAPDEIEHVELTSPSAEVQTLLELIPEQTGFIFSGLPDQPHLKPSTNLFNWSPEQPDVLTSSHSSLTYPNDLYPEDKQIRVQNRLGEWVEYPYYEDAQGNQYFVSAHRWYKQREYAVKQVKRIAIEDPLGAARLLYRFAQVYEGYVPTNDYLWKNNLMPLESGPPYHWWGGMWNRWAASELLNVGFLADAYRIVNQTDAFEVLSAEINEDARSKIVHDMFEPSVEFYRTFPLLYHNMEYNNALGLIALGKALNEPSYIHEAVEWAEHFVMSTYLFDGFFKETTLSYHNQSTNGIHAVANELNGWTDPEGYISPRTGTRYDQLDLMANLTALKKATEIPTKLIYPDGKYFPTHDTWAAEKSHRPDLNAGSFLLPATGLARLARGTVPVEADQTFGIVYNFANLDRVMETVASRLFPDSGTLQLESIAVGDEVAYEFFVPEADNYTIELKPFRAGSYGRYTASIDSYELSEVEFYSPPGEERGVGEFEQLGNMQLTAGNHVISFKGVGKDPASTNYKMGIIQLALLNEEDLQQRENASEEVPEAQAEPMQLYTAFQTKYGHHHHDALNLSLYAKEQELLPDIGYTHSLHRQWTRSTLGHNTVVVDSMDASSSGQAIHGGNIDSFIDNSDGVQLLRASQLTAYNQTDEYSREPWLIPFLGDLDDQGGYVLDLFRVYGGNRHEYTLQGDANRDAEFESDLNFAAYGPYLLPAGVNVQEATIEDDKGSAEGHYYGYIGVRDVQRTTLEDEQYELTLSTKQGNEQLAKLKITGLLESGAANQLFIGKSPSVKATRTLGTSMDNNNEAVKYFMPKMVLRREGVNLQSNFVHVMEPYAADEQPLIEQIVKLEPAAGQPGDIAVAVSYGNVTDIILSSLNPDEPLIVDDMKLVGKMGLIRMKDGVVIDMQLFGGTLLQKGAEQLIGPGSATGQLTEVLRLADGDGVNGFLTASSVSADMIGQTVVVTHPDGKTHGYPIKDVRIQGEYTLIELDQMDPGFTIHQDGTAELLFTPFTKWSGSHSFQIENHISLADMGLKSIEINGLHSPLLAGSSGQIAVEAIYGDGTRENVSGHAVYSSSDDSVAEVLADGVIMYKEAGTTVIGATYGSLQAEPLTIEVTGTAASTGAPGKPTLSGNNGHDTGLRDGDYTVTMNMWWGNNGSVYRLYENDVLIDTKLLSDDSPGAQTEETAISSRGNGVYTYRAELINGYGVTTSDPISITVTDAAPGMPVLSHDNWDGDGNYRVTMNMWWGTNGTAYRLYENNVLIDEQPLTAATPGAQKAWTEISGREVGTYEYRVELVNDAGTTFSTVLSVTVAQ
ncbi:heparinase II/III family protein [Paenibacillus sp. J5C_2022]|uniref:chitinase N-terminal domain-containing protein n=1 Tax=Paenibacillus sp. J5C2022 TaxID=2977129 RepID=UPI0021CFE027|nr:chitinase N-terminal domain-containing protein [Paenibacillus sp. J5C2022]MCU6708892.1 heparinase II/III family protein [Paenibacillus sp. J5C2022]